MSNEVLAVIALFLAVCLVYTRHFVGALFIVVMIVLGVSYGTIGPVGHTGQEMEYRFHGG